MKGETPEEKFNRLRDYIQGLILTGYPNPDRTGCPGGRAVENLAKRAADLQADIDAEPDYEHVMHCSPCYREFLDATEELRKLRPGGPKPMARRTQKRLSRTLDQLEGAMKAAALQAPRRRS